MGLGRSIRRGIVSSALLLCALAAVPTFSSAGFEFEPGSVRIQFLDSGGNPDNVAGAHPDKVVLDFKIDTTGTGTPARDLVYEFAPGLSGSPIATKVCSRAVYEFEECPTDTQVGVFSAAFLGGETFDRPIFNIIPAPGQLAALAFKPFWETELEMSLRPTDYGLNISTSDMPQLPFDEGHVVLWGVPGDHNGATEKTPFLTTPTRCGPLKFKLKVRSWAVGATWLEENAESEPLTGCGSLPFEPSLHVALTNPAPDAPTGAKFDLVLNQHNGPEELVSSNLKDAQIDLPSRVSVSPGGVQGREACTDEQFGLGTSAPVTCPFHSRVGSIEVTTPQLNENVVGSVYLGQEHPGERFRLLVDATAQGLRYKAVAQLSVDPQTGQLSTILANMPEFATSRISLSFEGGPHALLATSLTCGPTTAHARFVPYSGTEPVESSDTVEVGPCGGGLPYDPKLSAGSTDLEAGKSTGFALTLSRPNGDQLPGRFATTMPPGLTANLTAVSLCPGAAAQTGSCPADSKIGTAAAEVGSSPNPASVSGAVYLTETYKDAPFGLAIVFRAAIGPFDLGSFVVRGTLRIDPRTGQITIEHLLPSILEGVPLRFRTIAIDLDRPGFLVNPTSCDSELLASTIWAVDDRPADVSVPFNVGGCDNLGFAPTFSASLSQKGRRDSSPDLSFEVRMPNGQSNLQRFKIKFPRLLEFHNAGIKEVCARADATEGLCRPKSRVGTAVADTPLLKEPLRGPVYLVQPKGGGFPDLWSLVEGMGVKLQLRSESSGKHGNLVTEMLEIPDLPLSSFKMRVNGAGEKGALFSLRGGACGGGHRNLATPIELEGHDGAYKAMKVQLKTECAGGGKRHSRKRAHRRDR